MGQRRDATPSVRERRQRHSSRDTQAIFSRGKDTHRPDGLRGEVDELAHSESIGFGQCRPLRAPRKGGRVLWWPDLLVRSRSPKSDARVRGWVRERLEDRQIKLIKSMCYLITMAEGEGFEPSRRLPAYTLSKRAPSATRPPLPRAPVREAAHYTFMC